MFHNAEFYAAALRYAIEEMGHATASVNGIVHDPQVAHCAIVAMRYLPDSYTNDISVVEFALLVQPEGDRLVVASEASMADFMSAGGRRLW